MTSRGRKIAIVSVIGLHIPATIALQKKKYPIMLCCVLRHCRRSLFPPEKLNMASEGPPGTESLPADLGSAIAALNSWSHPELQSKLAELGAPTMGEKTI